MIPGGDCNRKGRNTGSVGCIDCSRILKSSEKDCTASEPAGDICLLTADFYSIWGYHMGMAMFKIHGVIRNYDWGTKDYLPSLLDKEEDGRPQAEYWMGTHPSGEAVTENGEALSSYIGYRLPYLFKVLSIASPLSLQCHPTKAQAEEGWKREEADRKAGKDVNYRDDNDKPEILCALTPVTALCGFRDYYEMKYALMKAVPVTYAKYLSSFSDIRSLFIGLFSFSQETKNEILSELGESVSDPSLPSENGEYLTRVGIIRETLQKYPGDIGSVFPLMMNVMEVEPGEALFLDSDTLHAYIRGNGIELMTASDNVLRGGLTPKRVDIAELERILNFTSSRVDVTPARTDFGGTRWYITPAQSFNLGMVSGKSSVRLERDSILLSFGKTHVSRGEDEADLAKGECLFVSGSADTLSIKTDTGVYIATSGYRN